MKMLLKKLVAGIVTVGGCYKPASIVASRKVDDAEVTSPASQHVAEVQFFNERVLGMRGTDRVTLLLPASDGAWSPKQILVDLEDTLCYAAMVHYPKTGAFETLRSAINTRFQEWETKNFASDPTMGIWRNEDAGFTIQLSEDDDSYVAIYIRFAEAEIVNRKFDEAFERVPELLDQLFRDDEESESDGDTTSR